MPNPDAEAYMAVRALAYGLEQARDELDDRLRALADDLGVRGGFSTSFGDIRDSVSEAKIVFKDKAALAEWVKGQLPHEYVEPWAETVTIEHPADVRSTVHETLKKRLYVDDEGAVVDRVTGEVLTFAVHTGPSAHWSACLTPQAKRSAREAILGRLSSLVAIVTGKQLEVGSDGDEEAI
jgi:hypothetical protein